MDYMSAIDDDLIDLTTADSSSYSSSSSSSYPDAL